MNRSTVSALPPPSQGSSSATDLTIEWLETNGLGSYASSTPSMCPTRRYHGLLVAPTPGTPERCLFLARFDEVLRTPDGDEQRLAVARYGEELAPRGDLALASFQRAPHPTAEYAVGTARLRREIRMVHGEHATLVRYTLVDAGWACRLTFAPIVPFRRADALTVENEAARRETEALEHGVRVSLYDSLPSLCITARGASWRDDPTWYRDLVFEADVARGYGGREDEFSPGVFEVTLEPGQSIVVAARLEAPLEDPEQAWKDAQRSSSMSIAATLERAADDFLVRTPDGRLGVVAGYPWFLEWGRDTFLSLPGLTLARGRLDLCAEVLTQVVPFLRRGLLPNIFGATVADSHYGSADAALWFTRAVLLYQRAGGDRALIEETLQPALVSIAEAYFAGTDLGLFVDDEGLLHAGTEALNPTWMDAQTSSGPVTPRHGCPVEIAALWCSLLAHLEELASTRKSKQRWTEAKRRAFETFRARLWISSLDRLADGWRDGVPDLALRPNMLMAAALEFSPLELSERAGVVRAAERALVTPVGLRTLAPDDPDYRPRYAGGGDERDGAYHQGTVWPWLFGPYVEAALRAKHGTREELLALVDGLAPELERAGLGHVSEVFDGDEPRHPGGTIAQAWNTAEWLRARWMLGAAPRASRS